MHESSRGQFANSSISFSTCRVEGRSWFHSQIKRPSSQKHPDLCQVTWGSRFTLCSTPDLCRCLGGCCWKMHPWAYITVFLSLSASLA